jgi:hypothetical protein
MFFEEDSHECRLAAALAFKQSGHGVTGAIETDAFENFSPGKPPFNVPHANKWAIHVSCFIHDWIFNRCQISSSSPVSRLARRATQRLLQLLFNNRKSVLTTLFVKQDRRYRNRAVRSDQVALNSKKASSPSCATALERQHATVLLC